MRSFIRASLAGSLLLSTSCLCVSNQPAYSWDKDYQQSNNYIKAKKIHEEALAEFAITNPEIKKEYCLKKEIYQLPMNSKPFQICMVIMSMEAYYEPRFKKFDWIQYEDQSEQLKIWSNTALNTYYYAIMLQKDSDKSRYASVKHSKGHVIGLQFTQISCDMFTDKRLNYFIKKGETTSPFKEFCIAWKEGLSTSERKLLDLPTNSNKSSVSNTSNAEDHKLCSNAADYEGCMKYQGSK